MANNHWLPAVNIFATWLVSSGRLLKLRVNEFPREAVVSGRANLMNRCPECYHVYDNSERFCETDGQLLLADPTVTALEDENASPNPNTVHSNRDYWLTGIVGVMVGILFCAGAYAAHSIWSIEDPKDQEAPNYASQTGQPIQSMRAAPARIPEAEPESIEEASPDPEAEGSADVRPESSAAQDNETVAARLNQGPVSTGQRIEDSGDGAGVRTIIQMTDGTAVEVDAAWEDGQGVWYRRGGLVAFVDSRRVKAITARADPKPSTASSQ